MRAVYLPPESARQIKGPARRRPQSRSARGLNAAQRPGALVLSASATPRACATGGVPCAIYCALLRRRAIVSLRDADRSVPGRDRRMRVSRAGCRGSLSASCAKQARSARSGPRGPAPTAPPIWGAACAGAPASWRADGSDHAAVGKSGMAFSVRLIRNAERASTQPAIARARGRCGSVGNRGPSSSVHDRPC